MTLPPPLPIPRSAPFGYDRGMNARLSLAPYRDRIGSAVLVVLLHALIFYALLIGLGYRIAAPPGEALKLFDVRELAPPPPLAEARPAPAKAPGPEGAAAPPNLKARPAPVVAPPPELRLPVPPPITAAPIAGQDADPSVGAAEQAAPGTGAGGIGTGTGAGRQGNGNGGGGVAIPARLVAGRIRPKDYPRAAWKARIEGTVLARLSVGADGRVTGCAVMRSSGSAELDAATCDLIRARFRYEPARDASGRPVPDIKGWKQSWWLERD